MFQIPSVKFVGKRNDWKNCKVTQLPLDIFIQVEDQGELTKEELCPVSTPFNDTFENENVLVLKPTSDCTLSTAQTGPAKEKCSIGKRSSSVDAVQCSPCDSLVTRSEISPILPFSEVRQIQKNIFSSQVIENRKEAPHSCVNQTEQKEKCTPDYTSDQKNQSETFIFEVLAKFVVIVRIRLEKLRILA